MFQPDPFHELEEPATATAASTSTAATDLNTLGNRSLSTDHTTGRITCWTVEVKRLHVPIHARMFLTLLQVRQCQGREDFYGFLQLQISTTAKSEVV